MPVMVVVTSSCHRPIFTGGVCAEASAASESNNESAPISAYGTFMIRIPELIARATLRSGVIWLIAQGAHELPCLMHLLETLRPRSGQAPSVLLRAGYGVLRNSKVRNIEALGSACDEKGVYEDLAIGTFCN